MSKGIKLTEKAQLFCDTVFDDVQERCGGVTGILLSTVDGHELTSRFKGKMHVSRLAAMTSSLLGLGETVASSVDQQQCKYVIVENSNGFVTTKRVGKIMVLSIVSDKSVNLGMLYSVAQSAADRFADLNVDATHKAESTIDA